MLGEQPSSPPYCDETWAVMLSTGLLVLKLGWKKDVDVVWAASTATDWGQGTSVTVGLEAYIAEKPWSAVSFSVNGVK